MPYDTRSWNGIESPLSQILSGKFLFPFYIYYHLEMLEPEIKQNMFFKNIHIFKGSQFFVSIESGII